MRVESSGITDVGLVRLNNEDVWAHMPQEQCYLLADGMGGHQAGEVAANEAVIYLCGLIKKASKKALSVDEWKQLLSEGIQRANAWVYKLASQDREFEGMGTTLCILKALEEKLLLAHVGDSRIYQIRKRRIKRLTKDHSLNKNVITRAVGIHETVNPEVQLCDWEEGDIYILCSDGLTDAISDEKILSTTTSASSLQEAVKTLVLDAKKSGGSDNITVLIVRMGK